AILRARELLEVEKRGETRFRSLTDSMPQCVWAARSDGEIYYCNRVWREFAGATAGMTFFDALADPDLAELQSAWRDTIRTGRSLERELRLRRHDGEWRWHLVRVVPERDGRGKLVGFIATATDIDQSKIVEEANRRLLASEKEARAQA